MVSREIRVDISYFGIKGFPIERSVARRDTTEGR